MKSQNIDFATALKLYYPIIWIKSCHRIMTWTSLNLRWNITLLYLINI